MAIGSESGLTFKVSPCQESFRWTVFAEIKGATCHPRIQSWRCPFVCSQWFVDTADSVRPTNGLLNI